MDRSEDTPLHFASSEGEWELFLHLTVTARVLELQCVCCVGGKHWLLLVVIWCDLETRVLASCSRVFLARSDVVQVHEVDFRSFGEYARIWFGPFFTKVAVPDCPTRLGSERM